MKIESICGKLINLNSYQSIIPNIEKTHGNIYKITLNCDRKHYVVKLTKEQEEALGYVDDLFASETHRHFDQKTFYINLETKEIQTPIASEIDIARKSLTVTILEAKVNAIEYHLEYTEKPKEQWATELEWRTPLNVLYTHISRTTSSIPIIFYAAHIKHNFKEPDHENNMYNLITVLEEV